MSTKRLKSLRSATQKKLTERLVEERKRAKLTQEGLASIIGWPQSDISKVETGERRLDVIELIVISEAIGFDGSLLVHELIETYRSS